MDQLQQASGGQGESIQASVAAANYAPLASQMDLGSKLMEQGFSGASATSRQLMAEDAVRQRDMAQYRREDQLAREKEMNQRMEYQGTLTQMISEMDDIMDSADMNDPVVADRVGAIARKRMQLAELLQRGGKSAYLGGILKQGEASGFLNAQTQGEIGQMRGSAPVEKGVEAGQQSQQPNKEEKPKEQGHWSDDPSSNEIN